MSTATVPVARPARARAGSGIVLLAALVLHGCAPDEPAPEPVAPAETLELRTPRTSRMLPGAAEAWQLPLAEERTVAVEIVHDEGRLELTLLDPVGEVRRRWSSEVLPPDLWHCQPEPDPSWRWVTDEPGPWRLEVALAEDQQPLEYRIEWSASGPATTADEDGWQADVLDSLVNGLLERLQESVVAEEREHEAIREELLDAVSRTVAAFETAFASRPLLLAQRLDDLLFRLHDSTPLELLAPLGRRILELREQRLAEDDLCLAETLGNLATLEHDRGRFDESLALELRSLAVKGERLDAADSDLLYTLRQVATILVRGGRCREATEYVEQLAPTENLGVDELAETHLVRGEYFRCVDDHERAEQELLQAIDAQQRARDEGIADPRIGRDAMNSLAFLYMATGDYAAAELRLRENLRALEQAGRTKQLATTLLNLGEVYRRQGKLDRAAAELERAHSLATEVYGSTNPRLIFFRTSQGRLHEQRGKLDLAESVYRESLQYLDEGVEAVFEHAENLNDLARVLRRRARYDEARVEYRRALELRERFFGEDHPDVAETLVDLARVEQLAAPAPGAAEPLRLVRRALDILIATPARPEARVEAHALYADLLHERGQATEAIAALDEALALVESQRPRTGGGERALAEVFARSRKLFDRMIDWRLARGELANAWSYVERARSRSLLDQMQAGRVDLRQGIVDPGLRAELGTREKRAKREVATCQSRLRELLGDTDAPAAERRKQIVELEARRDRAYVELQTVYEETKSASSLWRELITRGGRLETLQGVQDRFVPTGTLLLLYQIGETASHLFVVPPSPASVEVVPLEVFPPAADSLGVAAGPLTATLLEQVLVGQARPRSDPGPVTFPSLRGERGIGVIEAPSATQGLHAVISRRPRTFQPPDAVPLAALREVLVPERVWSELRRASEAIVIPDRELFRFPFEALVVRPEADWERTRFWLDEGPVVRYAPSATFLASTARRGSGALADRSGPDVLTVSDPLFVGRDEPGNGDDRLRSQYGRLEPLPGTALETRAIVRAFGGEHGDRVQVLQRVEATEPNVSGGVRGKRYVHIATHGLVDVNRSELFASLALTPEASAEGTARDGYLQLFEIYELDLDAELVVLSACNSNVGPLVEGEGAFALSRGFLAAGARRVVASLWPVADESTAELMGAFFKGVAEAEHGGERPSHATLLRDAKRRVRARPDYAAPFFWAPFVLTGPG